MNFERAMAIVFELEGGYVNDPADSGGATKFGISHLLLSRSQSGRN